MDIIDSFGNLPLHYISYNEESSFRATINDCLSSRIDIWRRNFNGQTALDVYLDKGFWKQAFVLMTYLTYNRDIYFNLLKIIMYKCKTNTLFNDDKHYNEDKKYLRNIIDRITQYGIIYYDEYGRNIYHYICYYNLF